jgi:hypothetical protein
MIKKFNDFNINESYKPATEFEINKFGFNIPVYNYVDEVFDALMNILMTTKGISEKSFKLIDDTKKYVESYFDNNQDILLDIDEYQQGNKRPQYCAEYLYDKHFNNENDILEKTI